MSYNEGNLLIYIYVFFSPAVSLILTARMDAQLNAMYCTMMAKKKKDAHLMKQFYIVQAAM